MSSETIERCDICERVVSDVLREGASTSIGRGYIKAKRYRWEFGPFPRHLWHRVDLGFDTVCDYCLDAIQERVEASVGGGGQ